MKKKIDRLIIEKKIISQGKKFLTGISVSGGDCIAGPIVGVALVPDFILINSELRYEEITEENKNKILRFLRKSSFFVSMGAAQSFEIENKEQGEQLAKVRSLKSLLTLYPWIYDIITRKDDLKALKRYFAKRKKIKIWVTKEKINSYTIEGAKLIAEYERKRFMEKMSKLNPQYDFKNNLGEGTKKHIDAIYKYGVSRNLHRLQLKSIKKILEERALIIRKKGKI